MRQTPTSPVRGTTVGVIVGALEALDALRVRDTGNAIYAELHGVFDRVAVSIVAGKPAELVALGQRLIDLAADLEIESEA